MSRVLSSHSISIVLCEDRLIDGEYLDFVQHAGRLARDVPVIDRLEFEYALLNAFHEHDRRHNLMAEKAARR